MAFRFKKIERRAARAAGRSLLAVLAFALRALRAALSWFRLRFTLVLVSNDHRPPRQISLTTGRMILSVLVPVVAVSTVPALRAAAAAADLRSSISASAYAGAATTTDALRDEIADLAAASLPLTTELDRIGALLEPHSAAAALNARGRRGPGALAFPAGRKAAATELDKLVALRSTLEESTALIREAGKTLRTLEETGDALPLTWPLKGGIGHISMLFGYNPNPFTGVPYLHLGLDLGTYGTGDPVVASADGVVLAAYYDIYSGFGNNVIISHEHGYYTRYAHLRSFSVRAGRKVRRGEVIGQVGATGKVDGPHLHYEIRLGPEILNPLPYIVLDRPEEVRRVP